MTKSKLTNTLREYSVYYRLGRPVKVSENLVSLLEDIFAFTSNYPVNEQTAVKDLFLCILKCQEREDWLGLADYIEYDLCELLNRV
mgnify:CR=1 FL=1